MPDYLDIPNPVSDLFREAADAVAREARRRVRRAGEEALRKATQPVRDARRAVNDAVKGAARAADRKVAEAQAGICAAPAEAISETDWAGEAILKRYLTGAGDWHIVDDPKWTAYMQASTMLRRQVNDNLAAFVKANAGALKPGTHSVINTTFHADVENGEGIVGYQYLHGTNANVGDFQVKGSLHTLHVSSNGNVEFSASLRLTWNDMIDPNPIYSTDTWKSRYAEGCTLGRAAAYQISITWGETRSVIWNAGGQYLRDK